VGGRVVVNRVEVALRMSWRDKR